MLFKVSTRELHGRKYRVRGKTLEVEATQKAIVVRDLERLIAQHDNNVFLRHVDVPAVWICPEHRCMNAEDPRKTGAVVALSTGRDEYLLLWGAGGDTDSESEGEWDDEDVGYQTAPIA